MTYYPDAVIKAAMSAQWQAERLDKNQHDAMRAALAAADKFRWQSMVGAPFQPPMPILGDHVCQVYTDDNGAFLMFEWDTDARAWKRWMAVPR